MQSTEGQLGLGLVTLGGLPLVPTRVFSEWARKIGSARRVGSGEERKEKAG